MTVRFEDIRIEVPRRSNDSPIEVTLFEGIKPTMQASSVPYAHEMDKKSEKPGMVLVGYPIERTDEYLAMTPDKIQVLERQTSMGGWHIGRRAIHSIRELHSE